MVLYVLADSGSAILTSCLANNLEEARKSFQEFYQSLDVHDLDKKIVLDYQKGLFISSICRIDFEKGKIKKMFKKECLLYG